MIKKILKIFIAITAMILLFCILENEITAETKEDDIRIELDTKAGQLISEYMLSKFKDEISDSDIVSIKKSRGNTYKVTYLDLFGEEQIKGVHLSELKKYKSDQKIKAIITPLVIMALILIFVACCIFLA